MKSSLEIALERANRIQLDAQSIAVDEQLKAGRRLVALLLAESLETFKDHLEELQEENIKLGFVKSAFTHLSLTLNKESMDRIKLILAAFRLLEPMIQEEGILNLFNSYVEQQKSFTAQLTNQIEEHLEQKSQAYYAKSGIQRAFTLQNDPELSSYYADEMKKFNLYFSDHLKQHKWQLLQQLGFDPTKISF